MHKFHKFFTPDELILQSGFDKGIHIFAMLFIRMGTPAAFAQLHQADEIHHEKFNQIDCQDAEGHAPNFKEVGAVCSSDWLKSFLESDFLFEPGSKFDYNSMNTYILSAVVTKVTGETLTEYLRPVRTVTTLVTREDGAVVSVKTSAPVPKDSIFELQRHIKALRVPLAVKRGDTVERNALGLGADIVVTGVPPVAR